MTCRLVKIRVILVLILLTHSLHVLPLNARDSDKEVGKLDLVCFGCSISEFNWFSPQKWNFPVPQHFISLAIVCWNQLRPVQASTKFSKSYIGTQYGNRTHDSLLPNSLNLTLAPSMALKPMTLTFPLPYYS